ncbi:hypothetical protein [Phenylobacterium sp.]|uniref:hypothetical protein n=1 Tax=Phenylobacterium sp. TaxID=1871053 RepID=UPI002734801D|nr:hypothetical protein [Phenylobacterium sp.]MDP3852818.1 hypothetical protein [Phenylobacterium sp.]
MKVLKPLLFALVLLSPPLGAHALAPKLEGKAVIGQGGVLLGHVERVVLAASGAPAQVLVRPKGLRAAGPRSLSVKALKEDGDALIAPISKAEFDAMPAVELPAK